MAEKADLKSPLPEEKPALVKSAGRTPDPEDYSEKSLREFSSPMPEPRQYRKSATGGSKDASTSKQPSVTTQANSQAKELTRALDSITEF